MGELVQYECSCDLTKQYLVGCGENSCTSHYYCKRCEKIHTVFKVHDFLTDDISDEEFLAEFAEDSKSKTKTPKLSEFDLLKQECGESNLTSIELKPGTKFKCPKCNKKTKKISVAGDWD